MVLKVYGEFADETFSEMLEKLNRFFNIMYIDNTLYLALRNYTQEDEARKFVKKVLKPAKNFLVIDLDAKKITQECQEIMEWCRDAFVVLETQRFEDEQQEVIKRTLDDIEKLKERLRNLKDDESYDNRKNN